MAKLRGAFTAIITPMNSDFSIDYEGFKNFIRFQLEQGITGLVPLGTTGETPTLEESEEAKLISIAVQEVRSYEKKITRKIPLIIGAGSNSTHDAVKYCRRAKDAGADYALVVTPYYNKPNDEGIFRHFEACSKVGIPLIIYNIAGRTGKNITTPLLARIALLQNIAGVKEASGDINQMIDVLYSIARKNPDFSVLSGDDALTLPLISLGGDGIISVVSNAFPKAVLQLAQFALENKFLQAQELHYTLLPFIKAAFIETNPCPIKFALKYLSQIKNDTLRLPLAPISPENERKIIEVLKNFPASLR